MTDLKATIVTLIEDPLYARDECDFPDCEAIAQAILDIPEIKEALESYERVKEYKGIWESMGIIVVKGKSND